MKINLLKEEPESFWKPYIFKFKTNAKNFNINYKLHEKKTWDYPNLGISASEGLLVMFKLKGDSNWYNFDAYARENNIFINMEYILNKKDIDYEVLIYGPILNFLSELNVEIQDQYYAKQIPLKSDRKMLIVGGMRSIGIGCTTTGMKFSNILSRDFDTEIYNITINNNDYLDKISNIIKDITMPLVDIGILELDYYNQQDPNIDNYLIEIIEFMRRYCKKIICWYSIPKNKEYKKVKINKILEKFYSSPDIIIKDLSFLHYPKFSEICTINSEFINDTGNMLIYKELKGTILEIYKWNI